MTDSNHVRRNTPYSSASEGVPIYLHPLGGSQLASIKCETVGEYYVNEERAIELGRRKARQFCRPLTQDFSFNLNIGYEEWDDSVYEHCKDLELITKWLTETVEEGKSLHETLDGVNVVIARGLLRRIAATPSLVPYVQWRFVAQKRNGIVFVQAMDAEYIPSVESPLLSVYHGIKFESFITREANETAPNPLVPLKSNGMFRTVCRVDVTVNRKKFTFLVTGEIDALDDDGNYVEIKLARESDDGLLAYHKCIKTWLQCTLAGVNRVVLGFKDEQGVVKKVKEMHKNEFLTNMSRSGRTQTQKNFLFLHKVVEQVHDSLQEGESCSVEYRPDDDHAVLTFLPEADSLVSEEFIKILDQI